MFNKEIPLAEFQKISQHTMIQQLGIELVEIGEDYLRATMPVDKRTHQPMGLLHGGASVALAETLGSFASTILINLETHFCVGLEINANHIKAVKTGLVTGTASPIHLGKKTHVWDIRIVNENNDLVCISRLTVAIIEKKKD